jgi:phage-related tail protein
MAVMEKFVPTGTGILSWMSETTPKQLAEQKKKIAERIAELKSQLLAFEPIIETTGGKKTTEGTESEEEFKARETLREKQNRIMKENKAIIDKYEKEKWDEQVKRKIEDMKLAEEEANAKLDIEKFFDEDSEAEAKAHMQRMEAIYQIGGAALGSMLIAGIKGEKVDFENVVKSMLLAALQFIPGAEIFATFGKGLLGGAIQGFQHGTMSARGGWAMVGERGPEIARFPAGTQVIPSGETRNIVNHRTSTVNNTTPIIVLQQGSPDLARQLENLSRTRGVDFRRVLELQGLKI